MRTIRLLLRTASIFHNADYANVRMRIIAIIPEKIMPKFVRLRPGASLCRNNIMHITQL